MASITVTTITCDLCKKAAYDSRRFRIERIVEREVRYGPSRSHVLLEDQVDVCGSCADGMSLGDLFPKTKER